MLSIILPCYNESGNIPVLWDTVKNYLTDRKDVEILFVNNGSMDNSEQILQNLLLTNNEDEIFRVITVPVNLGYGYGILCGLKEAKGDVLAWTHADLQTSIGDVLIAYDKFMEDGSDLIFVKGTRKKRQFHAWLFSYGMQLVSSWVLKETMKEINAQPKVFSRFFFEHYLKKHAPYDFSLDLFACYMASRFAVIKEIPVRVDKRKFGIAKGGGSVKTKLQLIHRTWNYIFNLKRKIFM